ncbi:hypothetical protein ACHAXS_004129 [Conticribra weissflogii]
MRCVTGSTKYAESMVLVSRTMNFSMRFNADMCLSTIDWTIGHV